MRTFANKPMTGQGRQLSLPRLEPFCHPLASQGAVMKSLIVVPALFAAFAGFTPTTATAPPLAGAWKIDGGHSSVIFKVKHMNSAWFYGAFKKIEGEFTFDDAKVENSKVAVTIPADSVDSRNDKRDGHLKNPDFFDVGQYPNITFTSTKVTAKGEGAYEVEGDLELRGKKKSIKCTVTKTGELKGGRGDRAGYETTFEIKRSEFGMNYGLANNALGDEVTVIVSVSAVQAGEAKGKSDEKKKESKG
jgi:polyisoprenoid-binding protein YceI